LIAPVGTLSGGMRDQRRRVVRLLVSVIPRESGGGW
jgi:hypothetical protein